MQHNHQSNSFKEKTFPVILVCNNVSYAQNVGSLFRASDAFGIEKIVFCGNKIPRGRKMTKTSRSTEKTVTFQDNVDILEYISHLKSEGYICYAIEITSNSKPLKSFNFAKDQKFALIIGSENFGVDEKVLNMVDDTIHIDMFGNNSSMNVVQAASITLYELTKQLN